MEGYVAPRENIDKINDITKYLARYFTNSIGNSSEKINLSSDDNLSFFFFSYSLCIAILSHNKDEKDISSLLEFNTKTLFTYFQLEKQLTIENYFDSFLDEYNNLRFFTKFSYLFDRFRPNLLGLSMKVSKAIE